MQKTLTQQMVLKNGAASKVQTLVRQPPIPGVQHYMEIVTPATAEVYLKSQVRNRNVVEQKVETYASDMKGGRWKFTADPIRFDRDGHLIDGQHRLHAVVRSGVSITALIVSGLEPESQSFMDIGRQRTLAHALQISGEQLTVHRASAARTIAVLKNAAVRARWSVPLGQSVYEQNREGIEMVLLATGTQKPITSVVIGALAFCYRRDPNEIIAFAERLKTGANLSPGDPALALRNNLMRIASDRFAARKHMDGQALRVVHVAWKALRGEPLFKVAEPRGYMTSLEYFREAHPEY